MNILLAIDASPASENVLQEALLRHWPTDSSFQVLTVLEPIPPYVLAAAAEAVRQNAEQLVRASVERLCSQGLAAAGLTAEGDAKTVILERAAAWPADLIIAGAHGAGVFERFLLGSVSRAVLRHAHCSVEIVRTRRQESPAGSNRVLLAVDGSDGSARAAQAVANLPWAEGTEIRVLSAVELHLGLFRAAFEIPALDPSHLEPQKEQAMLRAQQAISAARRILEEPTGVIISESISVLLEPPKQVIIEEAAEWRANLIVLGSHGWRGVSRFLMGGTSEAVAVHAPCSVQIVR